MLMFQTITTCSVSKQKRYFLHTEFQKWTGFKAIHYATVQVLELQADQLTGFQTPMT